MGLKYIYQISYQLVTLPYNYENLILRMKCKEPDKRNASLRNKSMCKYF